MSNVKNKKDYYTYTISRVIDVFLARNPQGTIMGVTFGVMIHFFSILFIPFFEKIEYISTDAFEVHYFMAFGVFFFNFKSFFLQDDKYEPSIEIALNNIMKMRNDNLISEDQAKIHYQSIVRIYLKSFMSDRDSSGKDDLEQDEVGLT